MLLRKYWIPMTVFIVAIVGVSLYYLQIRPPKAPIVIVKPVEFEKPPAKAPVVEQSEERQQDGDSHSDGTLHQDPRENRVQGSLLTESSSGSIPSESPETAVEEEKVDEQATYHPHDELSPEEHQRVHAELKQYGLKLDALIRLYEENLADLQAGRITPEESQSFLDRTNPERDSLIANIKRLNGE